MTIYVIVMHMPTPHVYMINKPADMSKTIHVLQTAVIQPECTHLEPMPMPYISVSDTAHTTTLRNRT